MATNDAVTECPKCKSSKIVDYSMSQYECVKCGCEWMVDDVATLRAENARLRAIVSTLAGWHADFNEYLEAPYNFRPALTDIIAIETVEDLCEQAWKTLHDGA